MGTAPPTFLSGLSVTFAGKPAAVYYVSPTQISVQVPEGLSGTVPVRLTNNGSSNTVNATVVANPPPLFLYYGAGKAYAVATHADGSLVGPYGSGKRRPRRARFWFSM